MNEAEIVLYLLDSGDWDLTKMQPSVYLTDEANESMAWMVKRQNVPYCDPKGDRQWCGPTAYEAFQKAHEALFMDMPKYPVFDNIEEARELVSNFRKAVAEWAFEQTEECFNTMVKEQKRLFAKLSGSLKDKVMLDFLDQNIFHGGDLDEWDRRQRPNMNKWNIFAPKGVQGTARNIVKSMMEYENGIR